MAKSLTSFRVAVCIPCGIIFVSLQQKEMEIDKDLMDRYTKAVENGAEVMFYMERDGEMIPLLDHPLSKKDFENS